MNELRSWIVLAAAVSFLAGAAAGMLLERRSRPPQVSPWQSYAERLTQDYDLSPERHDALLVLLDAYDRKLTEIEHLYSPRVHAAMEGELRKVSEEYEGYIRDLVLPEEQRARYDLMSRPLTLAATR